MYKEVLNGKTDRYLHKKEAFVGTQQVTTSYGKLECETVQLLKLSLSRTLICNVLDLNLVVQIKLHNIATKSCDLIEGGGGEGQAFNH